MSGREWVTVALIFGFLFAVVTTSQLSKHQRKKQLKFFHQMAIAPLQINIEGAVKQPGVYKCTPGITVKEFLKNIPLEKDANRKKIPFKKVFYTSQTLKIERKNTGQKISLVGN